MDRLEIDNILNLATLESELELEKATSIFGRLRWMTEEDKALEPIRQHLKKLIMKYEAEHWSIGKEINDEQIIESDTAEKIVNIENEFIQRRKELIQSNLKELGVSQKNFAKLLGHRPNYMSELINGVRPFSRDDIVVIHRLFKIEFDDLIPPFLKSEVASRIKTTLKELKNDKVKLKMKDFELV